MHLHPSNYRSLEKRNQDKENQYENNFLPLNMRLHPSNYRSLEKRNQDKENQYENNFLPLNMRLHQKNEKVSLSPSNGQGQSGGAPKKE